MKAESNEQPLPSSEVLLFHPNGDIHFFFDLNHPASADDLIGTIDFELNNGGADWLGICKRDLQADKQDEVQNRVAVNLIGDTRMASWTAIESEADLPTVDGWYLVTYKPSRQRYAASGIVDRIKFETNNEVYTIGWLSEYAAWMPLPQSYQPKTAKENDDER